MALLTAPEADVHFREEAVERFSGIIRERDEAVRVLQQTLTELCRVLQLKATHAKLIILVHTNTLVAQL